MKLYFIKKSGSDSHDNPRWAGGNPLTAYPTRDSAQAECDRLNQKSAPQRRKGRVRNQADGVPPCYEPVEVKLAEDNIESYPSVTALVEAGLGKAREVVEETFKAGSRALFADHPKLKSFGWNQDLLGFHLPPDINGTDGEYIKKLSGRSPKVMLQRVVEEFLDAFSPIDLGDVFGGCVSVTVHRDGSIMTDEWHADD